uniref:Uncharacterized protein n=1 Tax=Salix viminalis TaxID=40686 RepID=A0A6N2MMQ8_SALVM
MVRLKPINSEHRIHAAEDASAELPRAPKARHSHLFSPENFKIRIYDTLYRQNDALERKLSLDEDRAIFFSGKSKLSMQYYTSIQKKIRLSTTDMSIVSSEIVENMQDFQQSKLINVYLTLLLSRRAARTGDDSVIPYPFSNTTPIACSHIAVL